MATLQLAIASYVIPHRQPMTASDWRQGSSQRRYRDARVVREWNLTLRGGLSLDAIHERQFNAGACGAAEWDWTPPRSGTPIKVRFASFQRGTQTAVSGVAFATLIECLSTDT